MWHKKWIIGAGVVLALLLVCWGYFWFRNHYERDAYIYSPYATLSSKVTGHIQKVFVTNGQWVKVGEKVLQVDPEPYRLRLQQAQAKVQAWQKRVVALDKSLQLDKKIHASQQKYQSLLKRKVQRYQTLLHDQAVALQTVQNAESAEFQAAVVATLSDQQHIKHLNDLAVAKANILQAKAQEKFAQYELDHTTVYAPVSGHVSNIRLAVGDYIAKGQALGAIIPEHQWWAIANTRQGVLQTLHVGQRVVVYSSAFSGQVSGIIKSIGYGVARADMLQEKGLPNVKASLDWIQLEQRFPVWIRLQPSAEQQKQLRIGANAHVVY